MHAVARLDDAPAHLLDDACLHAPAYDIGMPELPELEALVEALDPLVSRAPVRDVPVAHFAVVKTATPPLDWLAGHALTGAVRRGKHLLFPTDEDLVLTIHLMTAGKLAYVEPGPKRPPGPVLVVRFADDGELVVSERVTRKSVRVRLLPAAELEEEFARLGPEPLEPSFDEAALEAALARGGQLHTLLRDQRALVGIGRAYANEILHAARLAPFATADRLSPEERERLLEAIRTHADRRHRALSAARAAHDREGQDARGLRHPRARGRGLPALRHDDAERRLRRPPGRLLPVLPDRRPGLRRPPALAPAQVAGGKRTVRRSPPSSTEAPSELEHPLAGVGAQIALEQLAVVARQRAEA